MVTLRVGGWVVVSGAGGVFADGDAVPDGDLLGTDEDVFDEQAHDALAFWDSRGGCAVLCRPARKPSRSSASLR